MRGCPLLEDSAPVNGNCRGRLCTHSDPVSWCFGTLFSLEWTLHGACDLWSHQRKPPSPWFCLSSFSLVAFKNLTSLPCFSHLKHSLLCNLRHKRTILCGHFWCSLWRCGELCEIRFVHLPFLSLGDLLVVSYLLKFLVYDFMAFDLRESRIGSDIIPLCIGCFELRTH